MYKTKHSNTNDMHSMLLVYVRVYLNTW